MWETRRQLGKHQDFYFSSREKNQIKQIILSFLLSETQKVYYLYLCFSFDAFRLGFIVDFLSHATIVGFMAGAATVVCLQQLKGMLGLQHFTTATDLVSVMESVFTQTHQVLSYLLPSMSSPKDVSFFSCQKYCVPYDRYDHDNSYMIYFVYFS